MAKIKPIQIQFLVTVEVDRSEPESFSSQQEFDKQDGKSMKPYLQENIKDSLITSFQYATSVYSVKIQLLKSI